MEYSLCIAYVLLCHILIFTVYAIIFNQIGSDLSETLFLVDISEAPELGVCGQVFLAGTGVEFLRLEDSIYGVVPTLNSSHQTLAPVSTSSPTHIYKSPTLTS